MFSNTFSTSVRKKERNSFSPKNGCITTYWSMFIERSLTRRLLRCQIQSWDLQLTLAATERLSRILRRD
jgi:hypothetical protein